MVRAVTTGLKSLQGLRASNQDRAVVLPPWCFVLDGVGGSNKGEAAAQIALAALLNATADVDYAPVVESIDDFQELLDIADGAVQRKLTVDGVSLGATTLTMARVIPHNESMTKVLVCCVGDSPGWIVSEGCDPVRLTPPRDKQSSTLSGALGWHKLNPVCLTVSLVGTGRLVLATDGVEAAAAERLTEIIADRGLTAQECADKLTLEALNTGGTDNVTVAVMDLLGSTGKSSQTTLHAPH